MNKLTKVLSVFLLAGALGASVAGATACKTTGGHKHDYQYSVNATDSTKHDGHCSKDGCDKPDITEVHHWNDQDKCKECGVDKPVTPSAEKLKIPATATKLLVEGVQTETIDLSTTKTAHDIPKDEIKVYFADASDTKIGDAIPAANVTLRLQDPAAATITTWTGLKTHGEYKVRINIQNCEMTEGATTGMEPADFFANVTVTINNPVTELSVKQGATLTQVQGPNTISSGWQFEYTRANGDKTDVAASDVSFTVAVDTVGVGENKNAEFKTTVDGKEVKGTVKYTITKDETKVSQSFAFNFGSFDETQTKAIVDGEEVSLQNGRFKVKSVASGAIDNHNGAIGSKYFTKRLKTNGSSMSYDTKNSKATPRYIMVHADGAGTLTVYAYNNGGTKDDGATRGVTVYSGVTFNEEDQAGRLQITEATMIGEAKQIPSKSGDFLSVSIPAAGDYYITNDAAMTYCYVQLDQLVDKEGNTAIALAGNKVYTKLSASHTEDTEDAKFSKTYGVGETFVIDDGYTFKADATNELTCEAYDEAIVTEGLTYWIGNIEITSGYTFTASDLGPQTVTVKLGNVSTGIGITVESSIPGVTGITAAVTGVNGAVTSNEATVTLATTNISVGVAGTNEAASATLVSATYKLKGSDGAGTALTAQGADLAIGEYEITVVGSVAVADGTPVEFSTTVSFLVFNANEVQNLAIGSAEISKLSATVTANTDLINNANGRIFVTATGEANQSVAMDANNKTIGEVAYTHRLKLSGTGTKTYRSLGIEVRKGAKIVIHCMSSSTGADRDAFLYKEDGTTKVNAEAIKVGGAETVWEITVEEAGTYYFAALSGGVNVYGVQIIYNAASAE